MKQKLPYLLIIFALTALSVAAIIVSCAGPDKASGNKSESKDTLHATGTVTEAPHLFPFESKETDALPETQPPETSKKETEPPETEATVTEPPVTLPPATEPETEPVTEAPPPPPSLSFESNGDGTCSVTGIGNITDTYVSIPARSPEGDIVTGINEKAFFHNSSLKAVEIPSTVMSIGDMAFADCSELVYITVDKNNKMFKDVSGVLYSIDLTRLICYPSGSGISSINVSDDLKVIAPMAFYGCDSLKSINYSGTLEDWSKISIGAYNYGLYSAAIVCQGN